MNDPILGRRLFTDGIERDVYQAGDGRQYVVNGAGLPVFGVWILTQEAEDDLPIIVPTAMR